jgi:hypothetical protein
VRKGCAQEKTKNDIAVLRMEERGRKRGGGIVMEAKVRKCESAQMRPA